MNILIDKNTGFPFTGDESQPNEYYVVEFSENSINNQKLKANLLAIEKFIYINYSQSKQSQDLMWSNSFLTKLKAMGEEKVEFTIVSMAGQFFKGSAIFELMKPIKKDLKPFYEKLLKISIRTEWAERCVGIGVKAISENTEPIYPQFPSL